MKRQRQTARPQDSLAKHQAWRRYLIGFASCGLLVFAVGLWPFWAAANALPLVRFKTECIAHNDLLTVGDLAEVQSADAALQTRLRAVSLGYAPSVGAVRELPRERIVLALTAAGFAANAIRLEAPAVVMIRRATQSVSLDSVRETIERATLTELRAAGAAARLARLDLPALIEIPAGEIDMRASTNGLRDVFAPFIVSVEFWQNGRVAYRLSTTAQVEAFLPVAVAARDLPPNVRLQKTDLLIEPRKLTRMPAQYLRDLANIRGVSLRRSVARGEIFTQDLLQSDIVIRPGDMVRIISQAERIQIVAQGEARSAGRIGDRIQIKNPQSGQLLQAIVMDEALVRVVF